MPLLKFFIILLDQAPKSSGKDVNGSTSKSNGPPRGTPPQSSNAASGPVTEEEIRAVLMQSTPLTIKELAAKFKARLKCEEVSSSFALYRICLLNHSKFHHL